MIRTIVIGLLFVSTAVAQPAVLTMLDNASVADSFLFSNTGTIGAAVCEDQKLRVWDLRDGRVTAEIALGDRMLYTSAISADGAWIAARAFEKSEDTVVMAHSRPVFFNGAWRRTADADYFIAWIDELIEDTEESDDRFDTDEQKQAALTTYREARAVYERMR
jgi:hypothetical protein